MAADRYFNFLYLKSGNAGVHSIRIHRWLAISVLAVFIVLCVVSVSMMVKYSKRISDISALEDLREENRNLNQRIDKFRREVRELEQQIADNYSLQNDLRLMAGLEPISRDVWKVGVGGPGPSPDVDIANPEHPSSLVSKDIDELLRQAKLERRSYEEILRIIKEEKEIRDCTPSIRPLKGGFLSSRFGMRMDPFTGRLGRHLGVDYCARTGTPVMSSADGIVTMARKNGSFGLVVELNHRNGFKTRYAHLSEINVRRGQKVKRGEIIGKVGNTGKSTGSHLHYEVVFRNVHRNPLNYIIPEGVYYN